MKHIRSAALAACALLLAVHAAGAPAATIWSRGWTTPMPPMFLAEPSYPPELRGETFDAGGDILIGSLSRSRYDEQITRFGIDGTLRWSASLPAYDPAQLVPAADGGAYATFRDPSSSQSYAARIDGAGQVIWAREAPAIWITTVSADRVAVANCSSVSVLDATAGSVQWQRTLAAGAYCGRGGIAVDAASDIYAVAQAAQANGAPARTQLAKFDAGGARIWERVIDTDGEAGVLGLGDARLYLRDDDTVIALDPASGSVVWRAGGEGHVLAGAATEPIVSAEGVLERLRAADGSIAWSSAIGSTPEPVSIVGGAVIALTDNGLSRIDVDSGAVRWTAQLPVGNYPRRWAGFGGLVNDAFTAIGSEGTEPRVQRIDFESGAMLASIDAPPVTQGVHGYGFETAGVVVGLAVMSGTSQQELRLRSVDGASGAVRWDSATPVQDGLEPTLVAYSFYARGAGGTASIAAAVPMNHGTGFELDDAGVVRVIARDRASGAENWNVVLYDIGQGYTSLADLVIDAEDNVFVAVGTTLPCNTFDVCGHRTIYKLAAADGSVVWRNDEEFGSAFGPFDPPSIQALGDDLLVVPPLDGSPAKIRRIDGVDGSETWSSDVFAAGVTYAYTIDAAHVVAFALTDGTYYAWSEVDAATGATLWSKTRPCAGTCSAYAGAVAPNGDLLLPASSPDAAPELARVHDDGSGDVDLWPVANARSDLLSYTDPIALDAGGRVWLGIVRLGSSMGSGGWYGYFDTESGSLVSSQALPGGSFGPPSGGTVLSAWDPPGGATETGVALVDATLSATGNLAAALSIDRSRVMPNDLVAFDLAAAYEGDVPIEGTRLTGRMPWASGATDLACAGSGVSNCTIDASGRDVRATFDIAPGGAVHVTGRIRVLDIDPSQPPTRSFGLMVRGPEALSELDTVDNFAGATVSESLFVGDFDSN